MKSYLIYSETFTEFKNIINYLGLEMSLSLISDFEKGIIEVLNDCYGDNKILIKLIGCLFHFIKNLYTNFKKFRIFKNYILK